MTLIRPFSFVKKEKYNQILPEKLINQMKIKKTNQTEKKITLVFCFRWNLSQKFFSFYHYNFFLSIYFFKKNGDITIRDEICRDRKLQVTRGTTYARALHALRTLLPLSMYLCTCKHIQKKKFHSFFIPFTSWVFLLSFTEIKFKVHV